MFKLFGLRIMGAGEAEDLARTIEIIGHSLGAMDRKYADARERLDDMEERLAEATKLRTARGDKLEAIAEDRRLMWPARQVSYACYHPTVGDERFVPMMKVAIDELHEIDPEGCEQEFRASNGVHITIIPTARY